MLILWEEEEEEEDNLFNGEALRGRKRKMSVNPVGGGRGGGRLDLFNGEALRGRKRKSVLILREEEQEMEDSPFNGKALRVRKRKRYVLIS